MDSNLKSRDLKSETSVSCENGKLIITPDAEHAEFEEAESIYFWMKPTIFFVMLKSLLWGVQGSIIWRNVFIKQRPDY